jgi:hypothetical protein
MREAAPPSSFRPPPGSLLRTRRVVSESDSFIPPHLLLISPSSPPHLLLISSSSPPHLLLISSSSLEVLDQLCGADGVAAAEVGELPSSLASSSSSSSATA